MQDRISTYQGRVTLTPVSGQVNTYDMVRADSPEQTGTPLNTENLLSQRASSTILTLAGVEPENPSEAFIQLSKVLYPLKKEAVGIASGSYTGSGASSGTFLTETFEFTPMVVIVIDSTAAAGTSSNPAALYTFFAVQGASQLSRLDHNGYETPVDVTWDDYTITLANGAGMNTSGHIYKWVVIGQIPDTGVIDEDEIDWEAAVLALIDPTLTLSDHAADAKAVGEAIADLEAQIQSMSSIDWVQPSANETYSIVVPGTIALSPSNLALESGESATITVSYDASEFPSPTFTWRSSDTSVATVSGGVVTWAGEGTATITCTMVEDTDVRATCSVTCAAYVARYVTENMELWLDAREYSSLSSYNQITDQSGNDVAMTFGTGTYLQFAETFVSVYRGQIKAAGADFLSALGNGWTIEVVFQNRYYNSSDTSSPTDGAAGSRLVSFVNGRAIVSADTRIQLLNANTYYGTANDLTGAVHTVTVSYDGTTLTEYLDGTQIYSAAASIDMSAAAFVEFFGNAAYSAAAPCSWNAVRVYSSVLSASDISSNRASDVANYGAINIALGG